MGSATVQENCLPKFQKGTYYNIFNLNHLIAVTDLGRDPITTPKATQNQSGPGRCHQEQPLPNVTILRAQHTGPARPGLFAGTESGD